MAGKATWILLTIFLGGYLGKLIQYVSAGWSMGSWDPLDWINFVVGLALVYIGFIAFMYVLFVVVRKYLKVEVPP